ncbi:hypothetical protein BRC83_10080 [Halobacteriales archaeon QS_1_68_17]|nr:MAG: hypothetical protein BRC83_10080 [Halobacteriales archaeon QS_1_68_17]
MVESPDPTVVRSVAVHADDVVAAVEARRRSDRRTVLRLTPPFSARMRARIHVAEDGEYRGVDPEPVHLDPESFLAADAPAYPEPAETGDRLRAADEPYTVERHRERHEAAVEAWRDRVRGAIADAVEFDTPEGPHRVGVTVLG